MHFDFTPVKLEMKKVNHPNPVVGRLYKYDCLYIIEKVIIQARLKINLDLH